MSFLPRSLLVPTLLCSSLASFPLATFAQDVRDKVQPATAAAINEPTIDPQGVVYGVPFGATEDEVVQKFGKPAGYVRLDSHRTALLYGKSFLLLCYDGSFDGILVDRTVLDWEVSRWATESAPFFYEKWRLSNGVMQGMTLKGVKEIVKAEAVDSTYRLTFSTEQCTAELGFTHWTDRGDGDETYTLIKLRLARKHDGKDYWSNPRSAGLSNAQMMKGKKAIGARVGESQKGVRIIDVYKGSPADKAGIRPGDLIVSLNGENTIGMKPAEFVKRIGAQTTNKLEVTSKDQSTRAVQIESVDGATLTSELVGSPQALSEVDKGNQAPDFTVKSEEGTSSKLSDLKGKLVLIEFTGSGCKPCDEMTQVIAAVYAKYKDQGLRVVSVYLDEADKDLFAYNKALGGTWPIYVDGKGWDDAVARTYGVNGIPTVALVSKDGTILETNLYKEQLEPAVVEALK